MSRIASLSSSTFGNWLSMDRTHLGVALNFGLSRKLTTVSIKHSLKRFIYVLELAIMNESEKN